MSYDAMPYSEKCQCGHVQEKHFLCTTKGFLGGYDPVPAYYGRCRAKKCICQKYSPKEQKGQVTR